MHHLVSTLLVVICLGSCAPPSAQRAAPQRADANKAPTASPDEASLTPAPQSTPAPAVVVVVSGRPTLEATVRKHPQVNDETRRQLTTVDPERVFQTATPGPGVPQLSIVGPSERRIQQGQSAEIAFQTAPAAPVSFLTREGGQFPNGQAAITVLADAEGIARTTFTATSGTVDDVYIQAGSPAAIGTQSMVVHVLYPDSPLVLSAQAATP